MNMQIFNIQQALEKVNINREIVIQHDDCLIPIHAIYIDTETNQVILDTKPFENECENCIHDDTNCPADGPIDLVPGCEFIPKNKIILYDQ